MPDLWKRCNFSGNICVVSWVTVFRERKGLTENQFSFTVINFDSWVHLSNPEKLLILLPKGMVTSSCIYTMRPLIMFSPRLDKLSSLLM